MEPLTSRLPWVEISPEAEVVALPPIIRLEVSDRAVVDAPPFRDARPVRVVAPVTARVDESVVAPAAREVRVPTDVSDDASTPDPSEVASRTFVLLMR